MFDDRICKGHPRWEHITLTCKNHPDLNWSTKNIGCIGARSIFFNKVSQIECPCSIADLEHRCNKSEISLTAK